MRLVVVIVNYNVKYFLEQCLESVFASQRTMANGETLDILVWVVDNASVDGSVEMVRERFPEVHLIANTQNVGFARANNQALREILNSQFSIFNFQSILLLNPDTVVEKDTLVRCVDFFAAHPRCGGLGVKMIDGEGKYLKESKRGFPTPEASFFKISGLIRLFPHNRRIAAYYMGHLPDDEPNPIDILPGAFLMVRQEALAKVGLLDESYFMYGEDIDFSWRIRLAGYENWYLPTVRIIHYKGESTKRGSMNYVYTFYNAMSIFVQHYFTGKNARLFRMLLQLAIWARATLSFLQRALKAVLLPLLDFSIALAGFLSIEHLWSAYQLNSQFSIFNSQFSYYPPEYTFLVIPLYILVLMACSWLYGGYVKPVRLSRIAKGMAVGSALLLLFYSLLDESLRYSRALLLMGCAWTLASTFGVRGILSLLGIPGYSLGRQRVRNCLIVGSQEECRRIEELYAALGYRHQFSTLHDPRLVADAIRIHKADEVVFCGKDIAVQEIIDMMTQADPPAARQVAFKIAPERSDFVIGTSSVHTPEDLYTEELNTLATPLNRRNKRLFDILSSLLLLLLSPILIWWQESRAGFFRHTLQVLSGKKSWVGDPPKSIFTPEHSLRRPATPIITDEVRDRLRLRYYRNYRISTDLSILLRNLTKIGSPLLILCAFLFLSPQAHAQYINAYVTAGAITSQIEGDELKGFGHWGATGGVGAMVRFTHDGTWSLGVEAAYSGRGVYHKLRSTDNLYNIDLTLHYVDIPVTFFFKDPIGGIRIGLGPVYSRLVQQPHGEMEFNPRHFCPDTSDMSFLKNDLALAGEVRFAVWNNLHFSLRYQYSLFPVKKGWTFTEADRSWSNDCYNQSVTFRLLWLFGEPEKPSRHQAQPRRNTTYNRPNVRVRRNKR